MKKVFTLVFTMLVAAGLTFAQATGGSTGAPGASTSTQTPPKVSGKKGAKTKHHKGGKKSKKGSGGASTTPPPK